MIGIINYNAGNLQSVCNTLSQMEVDYFVAETPEALEKADKIIFPGVGHAKSCMQELADRKFDMLLKNTKKPVLGICVGMQLLFDFSEEGETQCLGIIKGSVKRFEEKKVSIIPHMGWNDVQSYDQEDSREDHKLLSGESDDDYYFVHSYYCDPSDIKDVTGTAEYEGFSFCCMVQKENFYGIQFHAEKSGEKGKELLARFMAL